MEESLLPSGSSQADNNNSSSGRRRGGRRRSRGEEEEEDGVAMNTVLGRRQGAITSGSRYQKASAMVDQAEDGVGLPVEVLNQPNFEHAANLYFWFIGLNPIWALNLAALLVLNFFEVPLWCREPFPNPCGDPKKYYLGGLPYLTRTQSLIVELISVVILAAYTFFPISFIGNSLFWKSRLDNIKVALFVLLAGDAIFNVVYVASWGPLDHLPFRLGPYIRVLLVVANLRGLRDCVRTLAGIVRDFLDISALLLLFLLFSSWLAFILFEDTVQGKTLFKTYGSTLYQMSILYTTSNNPDVWLPAYKESRFSAIFFVIYILFGVYFVTNLVLAVVYDSFKGQLANLMVEAETARQDVLSAAFDLLDDEKRGYLDIQQCAKLFRELNTYRTLPRIADDDMEAIFYALDDSGDFKINREEFADLCTAISLKFDRADEPAYVERFPRLFNSTQFQAVSRFVKSDLFEKIIIGMLLVNLVTVIIESTLDIQNDQISQDIWQNVEFVLGWLYVVEMLLKVVIYGFNNYWRSPQNRFDFAITVTVVVAETLTNTLPNKINLFQNEEWIRYLLIARLLRLTRLLVLVERYQVMVTTFLKLIPSLMPYLGITFCLMCFFCTLGIQLFGGTIYDGNPRLPGSAIAENDYFVKNFNDFPSGMVVLFDLLITGNWHVWMDGFQEVTGIWWSQFYFWSFYVLGVLFLFNLVVAFVLEAFFAEMEIHSAAKESAANRSSPSDDEERRDPRDPRQKARRAKNDNVESLMNHILSSEIEKTRSEKHMV